MKRKQRIRCYEFIRKYEDLPEAPESLKQRILLAATRERNRQRFNNQVIVSLSCFLFLFTVTANSLEESFFFGRKMTQTSPVTEASPVTLNVMTSLSVVASPVLDRDRFNMETEYLDAFIQHKSWQSSLFRKPSHRL